MCFSFRGRPDGVTRHLSRPGRMDEPLLLPCEWQRNRIKGCGTDAARKFDPVGS